MSVFHHVAVASSAGTGHVDLLALVVYGRDMNETWTLAAIATAVVVLVVILAASGVSAVHLAEQVHHAALRELSYSEST